MNNNQLERLQTLDPVEANEVDIEDCDYCSQYFYTTEDLKGHQKDTTTTSGICGRWMTNESPELEYCLPAGHLDGPGFAKVWEKLHCSYLDS